MVAIQATSRTLTAIYGRWFGILHLRLISRGYLNDEIASLEPSLRGAYSDHFSVTDFICAAAIL
jgi:hypothetical protein